MIDKALNHRETIARMEVNLARYKFDIARKNLPERKIYEEKQAVVKSLIDKSHAHQRYEELDAQSEAIERTLPEYSWAEDADWEEDTPQHMRFERALNEHPGLILIGKLSSFWLKQALKHPSEHPKAYGERKVAWDSWNEATYELPEYQAWQKAHKVWKSIRDESQKARDKS